MESLPLANVGVCPHPHVRGLEREGSSGGINMVTVAAAWVWGVEAGWRCGGAGAVLDVEGGEGRPGRG